MPAKSTYTEEIGQEIARLMCDETLTMKAACDKVGVPYSTAKDWQRKRSEFDAVLSLAREAVADGLYSHIIELEQRMLGEHPDKGRIEPDVGRSVINSKQWAITKFGPKDWGDRKFVEGNLSGSVQVEHTKRLDISTLTEEQLDALEGALKATVLQLEAPEDLNNPSIGS